MADNLIQLLRKKAEWEAKEWGEVGKEGFCEWEAADALEAKDAEIEQLQQELIAVRQYSKVYEELADSRVKRIAKLEAMLQARMADAEDDEA